MIVTQSIDILYLVTEVKVLTATKILDNSVSRRLPLGARGGGGIITHILVWLWKLSHKDISKKKQQGYANVQFYENTVPKAALEDYNFTYCQPSTRAWCLQDHQPLVVPDEAFELFTKANIACTYKFFIVLCLATLLTTHLSL